MAALPTLADLQGVKVTSLEFEKDDDTNHHMDFIVACSNLQAFNYSAPPTDRHKVWYRELLVTLGREKEGGRGGGEKNSKGEGERRGKERTAEVKGGSG